ncbi:hypothetical protein SAMN05414139_02912 [Burkholderia sp. D7]|nr:hypothetical protein SAMN05414139_02912 [Burkholderia sp. D7]
MAIIRAPRPESNFYMLSKRISEDKRLSYAARGLLVFLLGKPDNWCVSPAALVSEVKGSDKAIGRDAVYALLKALITTGYMRREQSAKNGGQFGSVDYVVSETPFDDVEPLTENTEAAPLTDLPLTAQPLTANPTLTSIEYKQGLKKAVRIDACASAQPDLLGDTQPANHAKQAKQAPAKAKPPTAKPKAFDGLAYLLDHGVDPQVAADWLAVRKKKRLPDTETAFRDVAREGDKVGITFVQAVEYCAGKSWAGFYPESFLRDKQGSPTAPQRGGFMTRQERIDAQNATNRAEREARLARQQHPIVDVTPPTMMPMLPQSRPMLPSSGHFDDVGF